MPVFALQSSFKLKPKAKGLFYGLLCLLFFLVACQTPANPTGAPTSLKVTLTADGQTHTLTTTASNVRELLDEAGLTLNPSDEVTPPSFTPLENGLAIQVVRVTESVETVLQTLPFGRQTVRSEAMQATAPPVIIQAGKDGLEEQTVRIVFRDGVEAERWITQVTTLEPAQDEIMMIGVGVARGNRPLEGTLAYIASGTAVILRDSTLFPESLKTDGTLDGRVFSLSPDGSHLLYTSVTTDTAAFGNMLWVLSTARNAKPQSLGVNNVLWADWNPALTDSLQIAYTTANPTNLPPGWEANNDLWVGDILLSPSTRFEPNQIVDAYPATFGWWGGNYAWSPSGTAVAYSYANEVGLIDLTTELPDEELPHRQLQRFTDYNTHADWVWVPSLSWSPDGRYLAFPSHTSDNPDGPDFGSWVVDTTQANLGREFVSQAGMWGHLHWSPEINGTRQIAYLRAANPLDSQRSAYTLWLMDSDASNGRQIYPPLGETSRFPQDEQFMAWGPNGQDIAFVYDKALLLLNLPTQEVVRITQDDAIVSRPTWAPYGAALSASSSSR